jgi:protein gp37
MSNNSKIEWTETTWNPVTGCTKLSSGCLNCYAAALAKRLQLMGRAKYHNGFSVTCHPNLLTAPLAWRTPRLVFVNSMSDLFHPEVPHTFVRELFAVMAEARQHAFQVLTKGYYDLRGCEVVDRRDPKRHMIFQIYNENVHTDPKLKRNFLICAELAKDLMSYIEIERCVGNISDVMRPTRIMNWKQDYCDWEASLTAGGRQMESACHRLPRQTLATNQKTKLLAEYPYE